MKIDLKTLFTDMITSNLLDDGVYIWQEEKENGTKNPRARKKKKLTDEEYLLKIKLKDNTVNRYAQK
jgi:hypothetical protein